MKRPRIKIGQPLDYHEGRAKFVPAGTVVTYEMDGYNLTVVVNAQDGSIEVRNDNGGLSIEPVVGNVINVKGRSR